MDRDGEAAPSQLIDSRIEALDDPKNLFNASLDRHARCAIDIREGDAIDDEALKVPVRAAAALNTARRTSARRVRPRKGVG